MYTTPELLLVGAAQNVVLKDDVKHHIFGDNQDTPGIPEYQPGSPADQFGW